MGFQGDVVWDLKPTMIKIGFDMIGSEIIELNGQSTSNPLKRMEKTPWALQWEIIYKFHVGIGLVNPKVMIFLLVSKLATDIYHTSWATELQ